MPYKEKEIEKLYYTIGEVAQMFSVNTSNIRFWSKEFEVIRPATNKKGNRLYTQTDIDNFKKIYHLVKEKGFTLKGAKSELKDAKKSKAPVLPVDENQLQDNPVEVSFSQNSVLESDAFVNKIALKNFFLKMKSSLQEIQRELSVLEEA
jgi:DNA-binding transcriptional MerR regulator